MAELLYRLGRLSARRAWLVVVSWIVILAASAGAFFAFGGSLTNSFDIPGTASGAVIDRLADELPDFSGASGTVVFHSSDGSAITDDQRASITDLLDGATDLPDVTGVNDPFASQAELDDQAQQIDDGRAQLEAGEQQLDAGQAQLDAARAQLTAAQEQLDAARTQAVAAGALAAALATLDAQQQQLTAGLDQLDAQQDQLDASAATLEEQSARLETGAELVQLASGIRLVSDDASTAIANVSYEVPRLDLSEESKQATIDYFEAAPIDGVEVDFSTDIAQGVPQIFGVGEAIGLVFAAIVLLVILGSILTAVLPILTALVGVGVGVTASLAFSGVVQMASVTPVLGVMLGLAVGIDYSLFIINRHRRQVLDGLEVRESIGLANGTAGNAVVFAGSTVIVALAALNVTGVPFLGLMGTVGAVCVGMAVLIAITMTPALLGLVGARVATSGARAKRTAADAHIHAHVTRMPRPMSTVRAVLTAIVSIALLLMIAIPALSMRLGLPDGGSEPSDSTSYRAFTIVDEQFGEGVNGPLLVTADLPAGLDDDAVTDAQLDVARQIADLDDVVAVAPIAVSDDARLTAFQVVPTDGPNSVSTDVLVRELRTLDGPSDAPLGVAGQAAINIDISEGLAAVLPIYLVVVVGLSLLIMVIVFRSLLVPLIATGGFVLSLFATYGLVVAVFQWGWFAGLIGLESPGPILSFLPVILVGILFGLAMDYQLFLASGMREAYVHGAPARVAVVQGFRAGRAVVIAAALIMISVFGGFVFSESTIIRSIGFGLAFGVLLDAFVVRMLLMPALMHLLGPAAWWLPRWLSRIVPNVDVEGAALERRHHVPDAVARESVAG